MKVNRRYMRIFLIFMILFGLFQITELVTIKDPSVPGVVIAGAVILVATVISIAGYVLYKTK